MYAPPPKARRDAWPPSEAALAMLAAIAGDPERPPGQGPREYALLGALEAAGHSRGSLAELWLCGLVDVLESDRDGFLLEEGRWVALTAEGAERLGVRLEEDEEGRARWVWAGTPDSPSCRAGRMKRCVSLGRVDGRLAMMLHRRRRERELAEERARELLRQAEADGYLVDPRTGEPVSLWGVKVGKKTRRVGVAPRLTPTGGRGLTR